MNAALLGGEWSAARPDHNLPPGKTLYPFYRRLGGLQGRSGLAENLVPTGIRSRTVQPVAQSLYRLATRHTVGYSIGRKLLTSDTRPHTNWLHHLPNDTSSKYDVHYNVTDEIWHHIDLPKTTCHNTRPPYRCKRDLVPHLHHTNICPVHYIM